MIVTADPPIATWPTSATRFATGHQAALWHPGILAKNLGLAAHHQRHPHITLTHLVVDHDVNDALTLQLPALVNDQLQLRTHQLAPSSFKLVPTGAQPPLDPVQVLSRLQPLLTDPALTRALPHQPLRTLSQAWRDLPACTTLAQQLMHVTQRLWSPWCGDWPVLFSSELLRTPPGQALLHQLLTDAPRAVQTYNTSVQQFPDAGIEKLSDYRTRLELPLWLLRWGKPRLRVFVDLKSPSPLLLDELNQPIDPKVAILAPKALLLTALMRSQFCAWFVHGRGGASYDRVMEHWWLNWQHTPLAPKAMVTADLHLHFDIPLASPTQLAHAHWLHHHAPHNLDRLLQLTGPLITQKQNLLRTLATSDSRQTKAAAFRELHQLNAQLCTDHPDALQRIDLQLQRTTLGITNHLLARKRDWPFFCYPSEQIQLLLQSFHPTLR